MSSYKEQIQNRKYYVLIKNGEVLGTYGNLKKLCELQSDTEFQSYWTLARVKDWPYKFRDYEVWYVKHY